jgi:hypothetical protein
VEHVFELPGDGPVYRVTVVDDGFTPVEAEKTRPVYRWRVTDGDDRLVSMSTRSVLPGAVGTDHDAGDAWRRLAATMARDGEDLCDNGTGASCALLWIPSEREFLAATWQRWKQVNDPEIIPMSA